VPTSPDTPDLDVLNTVTPYLCVRDAAAAITFYKAAFGAVEHHRMVGDDGKIGHAEIVIGNSRLMMADEYPEIGVLAPPSRGGTSTSFTMSVASCDAVIDAAIAAGATLLRPIQDQFYGHRQGTIVDPFGHHWSIGSPIVGFDEDTYVANSKEAGFEVRRPD
jgi:PhnB protein